jgi:hypothetical protein
MNGWGGDVTPSLRPSPPQEGEGLSVLSPLPEGEGWVRALFVFFKTPLPPLGGYFPQRRKILECEIFPLGEVARRAEGGLVFSLFRFPREGGDPDLCTPPDRSGHILVLRRAQDEDEWVGSGRNPLT